ncbi:hypothetical protein FPQ18DRAFT_377036 [Pyronema domesticum]|nr:hypothetical protein FPQ18DRAFT_377036 [Pyronema domesticum]
MIFTNLGSIPIMATVKPNMSTTYGPPLHPQHRQPATQLEDNRQLVLLLQSTRTTVFTMAPFNPNTIHEFDASTNELSPRYIVYRRYESLNISPCINLGLSPTLYLANLAASKLCATEFGENYSTKALSNGQVVYKRLGQEN